MILRSFNLRIYTFIPFALRREVQISNATYYRWKKDTPVKEKSRTGRPTKLTPAHRTKIKRSLNQNTRKRKKPSELAQTLKVHPVTVKRFARRKGLKPLRVHTTVHLKNSVKLSRLNYVNFLKGQKVAKLLKMIYRDEVTVTITGAPPNPSSDYVYEVSRKHVTIFHPRFVQPFSWKIHACISFEGVGPLYFYPHGEQFNSTRHLYVLKTSVLPYMKKFPWFSSLTDYEDGASWHWTQEVTKWKENTLPDFVPQSLRPPYSPDFNLIENCFSILVETVFKEMPTNRASLKKCIRRTWANIPMSFVRELYMSIPKRVEQCLKRNGGKTDY